MKLCKQCGEMKPFEEYFRHKETSDGYRGKCKKCFSAQSSEWRKANKEKCVGYVVAYQKRRPDMKRKHEIINYERHKDRVLARQKRWREANKEQQREYHAVYRAKNMDGERARAAVRYAVERGDLVKAACCNRCSATSPLDGHHWSYEREHWLDVEWLCRSCHLNEHHVNHALYPDALAELT